MRKQIAVFSLLLAVLICSNAHAFVPAQYMAKMYSEALGRAPDPAGWRSARTYFEQNSCNAGTLRTWGEAVFSSSEFSGLAYDNAAFLLIAYRAILDREPDSAGYNAWYGQLQAGLAKSTLVNNFFYSSEFQSLVPFICRPGYSFNIRNAGGLAIPIPLTQPGGLTPTGDRNGGDEAMLEQKLAEAQANGGTVYLRQESVWYLTHPLVIPSGVTLATYGNPPPHQHGLMARLIRNGPFPGTSQCTNYPNGAPMVQLACDTRASNAALRNLWIDGQRFASTAWTQFSVNVEIYGGNGVVVDSNFIDNSRGWSNVHSYGSLDGSPCALNTITNNVITAYPARHVSGGATDGLSIGCEYTIATGNQIVDATDVGIVVFTAAPATQRSVVQNNTIVSAGNSFYAALGFDPLYHSEYAGDQPSYPDNPSFVGASIDSNSFWSGPNTHFVIGVATGSREWWTDLHHVGNVGYGAAMTNNTTAGNSTNMAEGIATSGMLNATVEGNDFLMNPISPGCQLPIGNVFASVSAGLASGMLQGPYGDVDLTGLMGGCN